MGFWGDVGGFASGIGKRLLGGGGSSPMMPGPGDPTSFGAPGAAPMSGSGMFDGGGGTMMDSSVGGGGASGSQPWYSKVGGFVEKNPELVLGLAGIGSRLYGANQQGQADQAQLNQQNQQFQENYGLNERQVSLQEKELQAKLDADVAEKARRAQAYQQILGMRKTGGYVPNYNPNGVTAPPPAPPGGQP